MGFKFTTKKKAVRRPGAQKIRPDEPAQGEKKSGRKADRREVILRLATALFALVFLVSCVQLVRIYLGYRTGAREYASLAASAVTAGQTQPEEPKSDLLQINFEMLEEINGDLVCWIDVPDTGISYPVVQGKDNSYYLRRSFEGQYYFGGVIFLDYLCEPDLSGQNTILYGHNMLDGSMFAPLAEYMDEQYFAAHSRVYLYTQDQVLVYRVFNARQTDVQDGCYQVEFSDEQEAADWAKQMLDRWQIDAPRHEGPILTLSTCTNGEKTDRYVVQAVLEEIIAQ